MIAAISARTGGQPSRRVWSARRHGNEGLAESDPVKRSLGPKIAARTSFAFRAAVARGSSFRAASS
jgi:hypothetical protein